MGKILFGICMLMASYSGFAITDIIPLKATSVKDVVTNNDSVSIQIELIQKGSGLTKVLNFKSLKDVQDFDFGSLGFEKLSKRRVKATIKVTNLAPERLSGSSDITAMAASASLTLPLKKISTVKEITKILYDTATGVIDKSDS